MTRWRKISLAVFFGVLVFAVVVAVAYDAWVHVVHPGGTISEAMAELGHAQPIVPFAVGFACGVATFGLAFHFWWGVGKPKQADGVLGPEDNMDVHVARRCDVFVEGPIKIAILGKEGSGVGSNLDVLLNGKKIGGLTFHEGRDWQVTNSREGIHWSAYRDALDLARTAYPYG